MKHEDIERMKGGPKSRIPRESCLGWTPWFQTKIDPMRRDPMLERLVFMDPLDP